MRLLLVAFLLTTTVSATTVSGNSQDAITSAITTACNGAAIGTVLFPDGNYTVYSAIAVPSNCSLQAVNPGNVTLSGNQNQILSINGNSVTINGLILNGGYVAFGAATSYSNFVFTNNTIENIWCGGMNGGPTGLSGPGLINSNVSNNTFYNIWGGGTPGYPNAPPDFSVTKQPCPGQDCWGSGAIRFAGLDQTTISYNTFDRIAGDGMHIHWGVFIGNSGGFTTSRNVIAYNTFTHIRRIPMEIQSDPDGHCPGGCNYSQTNTTGLQIKGNYVHDYAFPFYQTWGASIVPDGAVNPMYINNTYIANSNNGNGGFASCNESSGRNSIVQGNVCASVPGSSHFYGAGISEGGGSSPSYTSTYQQNIFCGNPATTQVQYESPTPVSSTMIDQYNYKNANGCPAGADLTTPGINLAFTSANNQTLSSGGNGSWSVSVISNLSIRYVQFFLDGSSTPSVTQEVQDLNTNFANDQKWLYHAAINVSFLPGGTHSIAAVATDVSGASLTVTQSFTR